MAAFDPNAFGEGALQRLIEGAHSLQIRVFRALARRNVNEYSIWELRACVEGLTAAIDDLDRARTEQERETAGESDPKTHGKALGEGKRL